MTAKLVDVVGEACEACTSRIGENQFAFGINSASFTYDKEGFGHNGNWISGENLPHTEDSHTESFGKSGLSLTLEPNGEPKLKGNDDNCHVMRRYVAEDGTKLVELVFISCTHPSD